MLRSNAMTIGQLSQRTGAPIKLLRTYERLGFLYTLGRSESNYRLFGEEALWCVQVIQGLRSLGLTLNEIHDLVTSYLERSSEPISVLLDDLLAQVDARVEARIVDLQALRLRIRAFQSTRTCSQATEAQPPEHSEHSELVRLLALDPRREIVQSPS